VRRWPWGRAFRPYRGGMPTIRLNCVLEYIAAKLQDDLSLSALAEIAEMNVYYFCRLFKQSTGFSPHRYLLEQRIRRAQEFLRTSDMTILEVRLRGLGSFHENLPPFCGSHAD
jgi:AraC family transcriptional regulator